MSTIRQAEANRRNAQKSTGPRSVEGKAASRMNALKTGIHAQSQIIRGEDPAELQAMADQYYRDLHPTTAVARLLVDSLISAEWQIRRLRRVEAELWEHRIAQAEKATFSHINEKSPLGDIYERANDVFLQLQRRIDSAHRTIDRTLLRLDRLRDDNPPPVEPDLPVEAPAPGPHPASQPPAQPIDETPASPESASFFTSGSPPPQPAPPHLQPAPDGHS